MTRDRIYADVNWLDYHFTMIDTGGIEPDSRDVILSQMREQAEIAIATADVMIVSSSMQSVQTVFDVSAATMKNVRQNLIWAAVYNVICIPLAASGIINPSIAAAAMALSSNGVLLNALRLKKYEP